jgi:hypothetical protein
MIDYAPFSPTLLEGISEKFVLTAHDLSQRKDCRLHRYAAGEYRFVSNLLLLNCSAYLFKFSHSLIALFLFAFSFSPSFLLLYLIYYYYYYYIYFIYLFIYLFIYFSFTCSRVVSSRLIR